MSSIMIYRLKDHNGYVSYTYLPSDNEDITSTFLYIEQFGKFDLVYPTDKIYTITRVDHNRAGCKSVEIYGEYVSLESAMLGWEANLSKIYPNNIDPNLFEIFEYDINKIYNDYTEQIAYRQTDNGWERYVIKRCKDKDDCQIKYYVLTSGDWNNSEILAISADKDRLLQVCKNINENVSKIDSNAIATVREFTELFDEIPELDKCQFFTVSFDNKLKHLNTVLKSRTWLTRKNFIAEGYPVSHINDYRKNHERGLWNRNDVFLVDVSAENEKQAEMIAKEALINYLKEESK